MAAINIRRYELMTLRITLCAADASPTSVSSSPPSDKPDHASDQVVPSPNRDAALGARIKLQLLGAPTDGAPDQLLIDPAAFGVPRELDWSATLGRGSYTFKLPQKAVKWLQKRLPKDGSRSTAALWLDLTKPYGYLGMVPWERLLAKVLPVPILRVPDFVVDPPKQTSAFVDLALIALAHDLVAAEAVSEALIGAVRAVGVSASRKVRAQVFCDAETGRHSREALAGSGIRATIVTADRADTTSAGSLADQLSGDLMERYPELRASLSSTSEKVTNPWLRSVRDSLGDTSIDIVHFIGSGRLSLERGMILLPPASGPGEGARAAFVGVAEFCAFQAQLGAWGAAVSSPRGNFSDLGSRQFADGLAQARPGPVLFQDASAGDAETELRAAYTFLSSEGPLPPPPTSSLFLYCEPFRVARLDGAERTFEDMAREEAAPVLESHQGMDDAYAASANVPTWMASTERFIDLYKLQLKQMATGAPSLDPGERGAREIRSALRGVQDIMASFASGTYRKPGSE